MISVIIATKDRPGHIVVCLKSLLKNSFKQFEIILIDQSNNEQTRHTIQRIKNKKIVYLYHHHGGKSSALNKGISMARGDIYAFTDDDCLVDTHWLTNIQKTFDTHKNISAVFGKTLPYEPKKHREEICPCTFIYPKQRLITKPCAHYKYIGFGNNMAVRASAIKKLGEFKEWLGPGSIGSNAEDAEFALRMLVKGHKILYDPSMIVYHNKWLTPNKMIKQNQSYACGEMTCYEYFHFQRHRFATPIVFNNIRDSYHKIRIILKRILFLQWNKRLIGDTRYFCIEITYRLRGIIIGLIYSFLDPLRKS